MNESAKQSILRPILRIGVVLAIVVVAFLAVLLVLDVGSQAELQEALVKTLLVVVIFMVASLAIWGTIKLGKRN